MVEHSPLTKEASQSDVAVSISELSWCVRDKLILNDISFTVNNSEIVGVIGPNGAGKSSLLRCLYRKTIPSSGQIHLLNKPIGDYSRRELAKHVAVVQQESASQFDLSVSDVISMGLTPHKPLLSFDSKEDHDRVLKAAHKVDMVNQLDQEFNSLSGGEKQRTMIARAIVQAPSLLLMDEPTNHLDVQHQIEVLELAKAMGITVIVSIHDLNLAASFCDRLVMLNRGEVVAVGSSEDVITENRLAQVFSVRAKVDCHPFSGKPRITYDFGGQV